MVAKILVGVVAALLVAGAGVYVAYTPSDSHGCSGSGASCDGSVTEAPCCSLSASVTAKKPCCSEGHDEEACCADKAATSTDALAACAGPAAVSAKKGCAKGCCEE